MQKIEEIMNELEEALGELDEENPLKGRLQECYDALDNIRDSIDGCAGEIEERCNRIQKLI